MEETEIMDKKTQDRPTESLQPFHHRPMKQRVTIRIDTDVLNWFKTSDGKYQTRINEALREYIKEQQAQSENDDNPHPECRPT